MPERRIRAILYGVGAMGKILTGLLLEKGVEIVGAIGRSRNVGVDLGEVAGLGRSLNVIVDNDAARVLTGKTADVVMMSFCTDLETLYPAARMCVENGMNVISIAEEAFYPWGLFPKMTADLDTLAKRHDVTITGTGIQDLIWFSLTSTLTAVCHHIDSVSGEASANLNDFGPAVAAGIGMGCSHAEFVAKFSRAQHPPTPFGVALQALVADLGLTLASTTQRMEPILATRDTHSSVLARVVAKGAVLGATQVDEVSTVEGPLFRGQFNIRPYEPGERDYCRWHIKGTPDASLELPALPGQLGTCTMAVNRIPDVMNAEAGFVTLERLPRVKYRRHPLHVYLNASPGESTPRRRRASDEHPGPRGSR